jgi:hypothetical protein
MSDKKHISVIGAGATGKIAMMQALADLKG